jgi:small-conductance mechanosensitive channel
VENESKALKLVSDVKKEIQDDVKKTLIPVIKSISDMMPEIENLGKRDFDKAFELLKPVIKLRTKTETSRKAMKDEFLKTGKAIDECAKFVQSLIDPIEKKLKSIVETPEREDREKKDLLRNQRKMLLSPYEPVDIIGICLEELEQERFEVFLENAKKLHQLRITEKEEQEKKEEEAQAALKIVAELKPKIVSNKIEVLNNRTVYTDKETGKVIMETVDVNIRMLYSDWVKTDFTKPLFLIVQDADGFEEQIEVEKI